MANFWPTFFQFLVFMRVAGLYMNAGRGATLKSTDLFSAFFFSGQHSVFQRARCSDGLELSCDNGERVRVAFALDCCDREIMSWVATTKGIDAGLVGDLMMQAVEKRFGSNGKPPKTIEWLTDNGSCYTAAETRSFAKQLGLKPVTTPVTSPQSNGMAESFVKTLKRDYAKLANRPDSKTVMAQLKDWFDDYNSYHPHSALGYLPPTLFREKRSVT